MKTSAPSSSLSGLVPAILFASLLTALQAGIPGRHGNVFDGCPLCTSGAMTVDGMSEAIYGTPNLSSYPGGWVPDVGMPGDKRPAPSGGGAKVAPPVAATPIAAPVAAAPVAAAAQPPAAAPGEPSPFDIPLFPPSSASPFKFERPPEVKKGADGFWRVSFANLASFEFTPPAETAPLAPGSVKDIPDNVRTLDGKRVTISGYMVPIKMDNGLATEFLLVRNPMVCCYGVTPAPNEWIVVKMKGKGAVPTMDVPLNFYGTLHVGLVYEEKMFAGIYRLEGEKISVN